MITYGIMFLLLVLAFICLACALYLFLLLVAASFCKRPNSALIGSSATVTLIVVIPAHNEEKLLRRTIESVQCCDYPRDSFEIVVVADNCTDQTAEVARMCGVTVLERADALLRGKGYALDFFIKNYLYGQEAVCAVIVIDADNVVTPNLLRIVSQYTAGGVLAGQVRDTADNASEGWRPAMQFISLALKNHVRALGRQALGCSAGLFGNGMFFSRRLLVDRGWPANSIVEDVEFTSQLIQEGIRIAYAPDAEVSTCMPVASSAAQEQKARWEAGQFRIAKSCGAPLIKHGVLTRSLDALMWGADLMIPPLMMLGAVNGLVLASSVAGLAATSSKPMLVLCCVSGLAGLLLVAFAVGGLKLSRAPWCVWRSLLKLPLYAVWKAGLYLKMAIQGTPKEWIRTDR